jgi:hypothetical protein
MDQAMGIIQSELWYEERRWSCVQASGRALIGAERKARTEERKRKNS